MSQQTLRKNRYESFEHRFHAQYIPEPNSGCWLWAASLTKDGYSNILTGSKRTYGHRLSYELHVGKSPEGMQIDHLCRVRSCVNPRHLEAVTQRENMRRSPLSTDSSHHPNHNANKAHCKKGHEFTAENTAPYSGPGNRRVCKACRVLRKAGYRKGVNA